MKTITFNKSTFRFKCSICSNNRVEFQYPVISISTVTIRSFNLQFHMIVITSMFACSTRSYNNSEDLLRLTIGLDYFLLDICWQHLNQCIWLADDEFTMATVPLVHQLRLSVSDKWSDRCFPDQNSPSNKSILESIFEIKDRILNENVMATKRCWSYFLFFRMPREWRFIKHLQ